MPEFGAAAIADPLDWLRDLLNSLLSKVGEIIGAIRDRIGHAIDSVTGAIQGVVSSLGSRLDSLIAQIRDFLRPLLDGIKSQITELVKTITSLAGSVVSAIRETLSSLADTIAGAVAWFVQKMREALSEVVGAVQDAVGWLTDNIRQLGNALRDALSGVMNSIRGALQEFWQNLWGGIQDIWRRIQDFLTEAVQGVRTWVSGVADSIRQKIQEAQRKVEETVSSTVERIRTWVEDRVNRLRTWALTTFEDISTKVRRFLAQVFAFLSDAVGRATIAAHYIVEIAKLVWQQVGAGDFAKAAEIVDMFFEGIGLPQPVQIIHNIVSAIAWFWMTVQIQFVPMQVAAQIRATEALRPSGVGLETAALGVHLGYIDEGAFWRNAARNGVPDDVARAAFAVIRKFATPDEVGAAFIRGEIDEGTHDAILRMAGYDDQSIRIKKMLYWTIPTPSDLIRMAVREVFSPDIAEKFGQYEDLPEEFVEWGRKVGLSEFWAKAYWAAHWDLPSAQMGFEMLHRGIIDEEELKMLLRALDVMPFWRERLIKLSYNPYTRVDIRRMYQIGVLSEEDVVRAYKDLGYDEEHAQNLMEFTRRYYNPEDYTELDKYRDLTQALIVKAYKKGVITRDDALARLVELKYHPDDAELILTIADAEMELAGGTEEKIPLVTQTVNIIREAYARRLYSQEEVAQLLAELGKTESEINWYITLTDYEVQKEIDINLLEIAHRKYVERTWDKQATSEYLTALNLPGQAVSELLARWDLERWATFRKPTEAQFRAALQRGLITLDQYKEELRGLGYDDRYVEMLARLASGR